MIDSRQLLHALALAEHGSFARAAEALHITQPALTRSIQTLEQDVGARLFDRSTRHVELTDLGRITLNHAQTVALALRDLKRDVALSKGLAFGELGIGVTQFGGAALVGPVIGQLSGRYPGLQMKLVVSPWKELPARLRSREVDLLVGEVNDLAPHDEMSYTPLQMHKMYLVCRSGHPLAAERTATIEQGFAYPTVAPPQPPHFKTAILAALSEERRAQVSVRGYPTITCESLTALKAVLLHSNAVSMMLPYMLEDDLPGGGFAIIPAQGSELSLRYGVARIKGRTPSVAALAFEELLIAHDKAQAAGARALLRAVNRPRR